MLHPRALLSLLSNITAGWKGFPDPNAHAYFASSSPMKMINKLERSSLTSISCWSNICGQGREHLDWLRPYSQIYKYYTWLNFFGKTTALAYLATSPLMLLQKARLLFLHRLMLASKPCKGRLLVLLSNIKKIAMDKRCSLFCPTVSVEEKQCLITLKPDQTSTRGNPGVQDIKLFSSSVIPWKTKLECLSL